eukprot:CCRYP_012329-RA/>CCRYP_012329-RA protein AED:0.59 eAED:0.59 QI:0/0/0/0.5/1/1/2/0/84
MDSMLGRGIQSTGNEYCPWLGHVLGGIPKVSRNGKDRLDDVLETCHGVMVRIDSDGTTEELGKDCILQENYHDNDMMQLLNQVL